MISLALALALSLTSGQVGQCSAGKNCTVRSISALATGTSTLQMACFQNSQNAVTIRRNAQYLNFAVQAACSSTSVIYYPMSFNTTSPAVVLGSNFPLYVEGAATAATLPSPTYPSSGISADVASRALWKTDAQIWTDIGSGAHPVLEKQTYVLGWKAASVGFESGANPPTSSFGEITAPTETCVSGTVANVANMPIAGATIGLGRDFLTQAAINATCNDASSAWLKWNNALPRQCFRIRTDSAAITTTRLVAGFAVSTVFTAATDSPATEGAWVRYSTSAGDTNWMGCTSNGAAATCTSLGIAVAANTRYLICIDGRTSGAVSFYVDGQTRLRQTTNLPASTDLSFGSSITALAASARRFTISKRSFEISQ